MKVLTIYVFSLALASAACAQINVGSDGSDGAISLGGYESRTLETNDAALLPWNSPSPVAGKGVYDGAQWAVVYKFTTLTLANNASLRFSRHRTNAPIVILCSGAVSIGSSSVISVAGSGHSAGNGGFDGAFASSSGVPNGAGFGPGGGDFSATSVAVGGSHGSLGIGATDGIYSNSAVFPLIGGSGGNARSGARGGGGGGAVILASNTTINILGSISAEGGNLGYGTSGGSGGGIRIICNSLSGAGAISALGAAPSGGGAVAGGAGRIRLEVNASSFTGTVNPSPNATTADANPVIFPSTLQPTAKITQVGSAVVGADPSGNMIMPDLNFTSGGPYMVQIVCTNVPTDGTWAVNLRLTPRNGQDVLYPCILQSGNQAVSIWTVNLSLTQGLSALQVRAHRL